jgi:hypothetical protein
MAITLASIPPSTLKADIRSVLQRFCEVKGIFVYPDGRRANVHGAKRIFHAYVEQLLRVPGWETIRIAFRKHTNRGVARAVYIHYDFARCPRTLYLFYNVSLPKSRFQCTKVTV